MSARAFVGLGSNMGRPACHVRAALRQLAALPSTRLVGESGLYATSPIGPRNQPDFVNAVAELNTALDPLVLLDHLQGIESRHRRVRIQRWGRRTLDLDILLYDARILSHPRLQLPHPRLHQRLFVLAPLHELAPDLVIPGKGGMARLLDRLSTRNGSSVRRLAGQAASG